MSITGLAGMINIKGLVPELLPPAEIFAGTAAPFRFRLHNNKRYFPSFLIKVAFSEGKTITLPVISSDSILEESIELMLTRRGPARIGTITVSSPFPVNFFTRYWIFAVDTEVIVFPRLRSTLFYGTGSEIYPVGASPRWERGDEGELERIAGYSGREPLRVIHWKLSARSGELQVKEFGRQSAVPLVIELDRLAGNSLEDRISSAAWLVRRWVDQRPVGIQIGDRSIAALTGRRHGTRLLTELALHGLN